MNGTASLSFANTSGANLRCEAPNQDESNRPGVTVSTGTVIAAATEYYERFQVVPAGEINIEQSIPLLGGIDILAAFWPLLQLVPSGSAAQFMSERVQLQSVIVEGHREANISGLAGTAGAFTVNNGATWTGTVPLGAPSTNPRGEDKVGAIIVCGNGGTQGSQQLYAWSGYEDGWTPPAPLPGDGTRTLGSLVIGGPGPDAGDGGDDGADDGIDDDIIDDGDDTGGGEG